MIGKLEKREAMLAESNIALENVYLQKLVYIEDMTRTKNEADFINATQQ